MCKHSCIRSAICKRGIFRASKARVLAPKARILWMQAFVAAVLFCLPAAAQIPDVFRSSLGWRIDDFDSMSANTTPVLDRGMGAFPTIPQQSQAPAKVSADVLRHPISEKARRILVKVLALAEKGEHARAVAALQEGMEKERTLLPYSHGLLGAEYLHLGRTAEAVPEFVEDARVFPHDATAHSNLALVLCMTLQFDHAEQEARMALYLDPNLHPAQEIMQIIAEDNAKLARRN